MRALRRDESFEEAFDHLFGRAQQVAFRVLGDWTAAEDIAAEALTRAFADWRRVRDLEYRDAWVLRVTTNLAIDACRRKQPDITVTAVASADDVVALRLTLAAALHELPRRQRDAVSLHYLGGLTDDEVASALGIAVGTVKAHIHRGMTGLEANPGVGVVTPAPDDGSTTTTTVAGSVSPVSPTTVKSKVYLVPPAPLVPPVQPVGHWVAEDSGTSETLRAVSFPDAEHGWAVGDNGTVIATSDGGAHWTPQTVPSLPQGPGQFFGVSFVDSSHGWAVGWGGQIVATSDGGAHWVTQAQPETNANFMGVSFVDRNHGWAISFDAVVATTDGGAHWTQQFSESDGAPPPGYSVFFKDQQHGWSGWGSGLFATTDGGAHWVKQSPSTSTYGISFVDNHSGWAVGPQLAVSTADGGASWNPANVGPNLGVVAATDKTHAWVTASGNGGIILATADGVNWFQQWQGGPGFNGISFPDSAHGWAVGNGGIIVRYLSS